MGATSRADLVAILASGPSITRQQIDVARRAAARLIAINRTYELAPDADALFAADAAWWMAHPEAERFAGAKYVGEDQRIPYAQFVPPHRPNLGGNSALHATRLAASQGAKLILLLGVDLRDDQLTHWHGDYRSVDAKSSLLVNPNAETFRRARKAWTAYSETYDRPTVINCSPGSALDCFPKMSIEDAVAAVMA